MAAQKGNKHNTKFKTPAERQQVCAAYIEHCKKGYPDESFPLLTPKGIQFYIKTYKKDFPIDQIREARSARIQFWFDVGSRGTMGIPISYKDVNGKTKLATHSFNPKSWQFIMMNLFKWRNRDDVTTKDDKLPAGGGHVIYLPKMLPDDYDEKMKPNARAKSPAK